MKKLLKNNLCHHVEAEGDERVLSHARFERSLVSDRKFLVGSTPTRPTRRPQWRAETPRFHPDQKKKKMSSHPFK